MTTSMEVIVRPWVRPSGRPSAAIPQRPPENIRDEEAILRWGGESELTDVNRLNKPHVVIIDPDDQEEPEDVPIPRYAEIDKIVEVVRVTNPQDAEDWVDVERRISSLLQTDIGTQFWIDWMTGDEPAGGGGPYPESSGELEEVDIETDG